jgi:hypothetical protein
MGGEPKPRQSPENRAFRRRSSVVERILGKIALGSADWYKTSTIQRSKRKARPAKCAEIAGTFREHGPQRGRYVGGVDSA